MTGVVAYAMQLGETDRTIDDDLRVRTVAFLDLAAGVDPQTGLPWAGAEPLLRAGIGQVTATATESAVGHVNGRATFVSGGDIRLDLASDAEFLAQSDASAQNSVTVQSAKTSQREYRYVSVPIKDETGKTIATFTIATDRGEIVHELNESFGGFAIAGVIALSILGAVAWVTVGRLLRPIRLLDSTAREISESDLRSRIPIVGNDDLARLSVTVNDMLDRVEAGYEAQRQLLDDAGHELRTPLAVMRTNLELLEPRDPGQVEDSQKLLLDEISMMARLVDDLVVLAKADRPEFVTHERVDVADLTNAAFARAQALGDRTWVLEQTADGVVTGDLQRLLQAWMQLVANAVKYSKDGTEVGLGSSLEDGTLRLWVRDQGIGIAKENHARVMGRFGRVDDKADGAGLGLPIVSAIAHSHGGTVELDSVLGVGSLFTIVIPVEGHQ